MRRPGAAPRLTTELVEHTFARVDTLDWAGLATTTLVAALLQAASGFGFAVLATPLFLLFVDPPRATQLVIIVTTALSVVVLPGLRRALVPGLLPRLLCGCLAGLPAGLFAFRNVDPILLRTAVGAIILAFTALLACSRLGFRHPWLALRMRPGLDVAAGAMSGIATALIGMAGPPVLIYLLLAGIAPRTVRATLLSFFALAYTATLVSHVASIGVPEGTWVTAAILMPFAWLGGLIGRPVGDRLGASGFAILAIALLAAAGLYTLVAAAIAVGRRLT
jgi:uncharacterized membrane protein YfcA